MQSDTSNSGIKDHLEIDSFNYAPRRVRNLPPINISGRMMKVYEIFAEKRCLADTLSIEKIQEQATVVLPQCNQRDHAVGFLIVHYGEEGTYLLLSQWYGVDMLKHWVRNLVIKGDGEIDIIPLEEPNVIACVWELEIIKFERDAWVNTMLRSSSTDRPSNHDSIDDYIATCFSGWV